MCPIKAKKVIERMNSVLDSVRNQNSGADVHTIGNIRNTAVLLIQQIEDDPECITDELAEQIMRNTEERLIRFYKEKYHHVTRPHLYKENKT